MPHEEGAGAASPTPEETRVMVRKHSSTPALGGKVGRRLHHGARAGTARFLPVDQGVLSGCGRTTDYRLRRAGGCCRLAARGTMGQATRPRPKE